MSANSKTIEDLKRRLMESWSVYDENDNPDTTATCLDMRGESMTSPTNSPTWQYIPSPNQTAKKGARGRFSIDGNDSSARNSGFKLSPKPSGKPLEQKCVIVTNDTWIRKNISSASPVDCTLHITFLADTLDST